MKIQILYDNMIIAEKLTSVQDTVPEKCECCGRLKRRIWQVVQTDEAVERISGIMANTRLQVRMEPE